MATGAHEFDISSRETGAEPQLRQNYAVRSTADSVFGSHDDNTGAVSSGSRAALRTPSTRQKVEVGPTRAWHVVRALFTACIADVTRAIDEHESIVCRSNALDSAKYSLQELWNVRGGKEEAYAECVHLMQVTFLERSIEDFTRSQLTAIRTALEHLREETVIDDSVANEITAILIRGGIDVFRELA